MGFVPAGAAAVGGGGGDAFFGVTLFAVLLLALVLVAVVLEPYLHLGRGQADRHRHLFTFRGGQVFLVFEHLLQLEHLRKCSDLVLILSVIQLRILGLGPKWVKLA